jgi:hypothetical protein
VIDVLGKVVYTNTTALDAGYNQLYFDATNLAAGTYSIVLKDQNNSRLAQKRFVKIDR